MKKYLFLLFAVCAAVFVSCSDDDDNDKYVMPQLSPNNTNISVEAGGGQKILTVSNAVELNITQINNKTVSSGKTSETDVMSIANGKLKDSKLVTEGGWFTAEVVKVNGVYNQIVINVTANTGTESRDKYIHVTCGGKLYGLSLHLSQDKPSSN